MGTKGRSGPSTAGQDFKNGVGAPREVINLGGAVADYGNDPLKTVGIGDLEVVGLRSRFIAAAFNGLGDDELAALLGVPVGYIIGGVGAELYFGDSVGNDLKVVAGDVGVSLGYDILTGSEVVKGLTPAVDRAQLYGSYDDSVLTNHGI